MSCGEQGIWFGEPGFIDFIGEEDAVPAQGDCVDLTPVSILTVMNLVPLWVGSWSLVKKAS